MCGRYALYCDLPRLQEAMGFRAETEPSPRYNIAPSQEAPVVRPGEDGGRRLVAMRWGLVPHWSRGPDPRYSMINARADTLGSKPAYRDAYRRRRCLVPADGFYEWRAAPGGKGPKQPFFLSREDGAPMAFAGLWERWQPGEGGAPLLSFTIVTTDANPMMQPIHPRMPVVLEPSDYPLWLGEEDPGRVGELLRPYPGDDLVARPVSRAVNRPENEGPELIAPQTEENE